MQYFIWVRNVYIFPEDCVEKCKVSSASVFLYFFELGVQENQYNNFHTFLIINGYPPEVVITFNPVPAENKSW